jgi:2'-5' RNA ligase
MEKFTQKWAISSLLEKVSEGSEFYYTEFPLHITLADVFKVNQDGLWLATELTKLLANQESFVLTAAKQAMFGPDENIAVVTIEKSEELMGLYRKIHAWLNSVGVHYNEPQYQGEGYSPHSTVQKTGQLQQGQKVSIQSVSIVDLLPSGNGHQRKIFKTIELK